LNVRSVVGPACAVTFTEMDLLVYCVETASKGEKAFDIIFASFAVHHLRTPVDKGSLLKHAR
jgi:hydrogenase maturation factor